ncbi:MAG: VWA domain-containing protein [Pyrinomonadaceae bacterium]
MKFFAPNRTFRRLAALGLIAWLGALPVIGQSGRNKQPAPDPKKTTKPRPPTGATILPATAKPSPTPPAGDEVNPEDIVRVAANLVTVPASVVDSSGQAITDLTLQDFELMVDGEAKSITELQRSDAPVRLALLFDNSSSLSKAREFEKQAAIRFFRRVMRKQDQASVYSVSTNTDLVQPMTGNTKLLVQAIENFGSTEGATSLFDGIVLASQDLHQQSGRRVIVIVSDGDDTVSDTKFEDSVRTAQAADCQVYVVQTTKIENAAITGNAVGSANLRALAAERRMEQLTNQTGGTVYAPYSTKELDPAFTQIAADLAQQYILSYYPQDEKFDGRYRQLTVRIPTRQNVRIRSRKGYYTPKG